ncbi:MAG TPA: hypothetical protein VL463_19465 [Kofleriaceae bacterium]|nr:hypothetical protein [Kofleriaceae bacterium]
MPDLRPGDPVITVHEDRARALPPALTVTADGRFRLVEPRLCPTTEVVEMQGSTLVRTKPNYATFVVGAILTSLGAIGTGVAISEGHPEDHPIGYVSPIALGAGLVFAIGPFVGNSEDRAYDAAQKVERNGKDAPCGDHPLAASKAILTWRGLRAVATVDGEGFLSTSPFELVDAFSAGRGPAFDVGVDVTMQNGDRHAVQSVIAGADLIKGRDAFLARLGVDGRWEQLRKVPRVEPGAIRASRTTVSGQPVLRVVLPLDNNGPGDAWQVRGEIATADPEVDGRTIYVGHLAPHGHTIATVDIPLSDESDRAIADSTLELAITLIDADATTSAEPVRFKGQVLQDVPR